LASNIRRIADIPRGDPLRGAENIQEARKQRADLATLTAS
jgi:hypothetical protein